MIMKIVKLKLIKYPHMKFPTVDLDRLAPETLTNSLVTQLIYEIYHIKGNLVLRCVPNGQDPEKWFKNVWMHRETSTLGGVTPFDAIQKGDVSLVIHHLTPKVDKVK